MSNQTRKKVLYLITKSNWGGAQRYVYDLATGLDQSRYEPVVALGGNGPLSELLQHAGIRTINIDSLTRNIDTKKEWLFVKELWRILKEERPDVLHVNSSKAGAVGTIVGQLARVPRIIFTAHGWAFNEDRPWSQRLLIKLIHYLTVLCSDFTIAVSGSIITQMNWPFAENRMKLVHPGRVIGVMYEAEEARKKISDFFPSLQTHHSSPWIISIAELHPIKQLNVLLDALPAVFEEYPEAISVIIGEGEQRKQLEEHIDNLALSKRVFLVGAITEAARFLRAGTLFVLPSRSESYGYVLHEAGLAHIPVVATNVGGIPDIIDSPQEGLLVPSHDKEALAMAIIDTLSNPRQANERADKLEKKMHARNTMRMISATTTLYEQH